MPPTIRVSMIGPISPIISMLCNMSDTSGAPKSRHH
jgi:hypothetical protein